MTLPTPQELDRLRQILVGLEALAREIDQATAVFDRSSDVTHLRAARDAVRSGAEAVRQALEAQP